MAIDLPKETRQQLTASIKHYFVENLNEEIGDLKAALFLDFCVKEIGASIYNQAISDAQAYMENKVSDLESSCYEPEFSYWTNE